MKERVIELKNRFTERANYYKKISFEHLANEFTEFVKFLSEIEKVIEENERLRAQIQTLEEVTNASRENKED